MPEAEQLFPEEIRRFKADLAANPMPGGEDPNQAACRGASALRAMATTCPRGRVLVVTHNTLIRLTLCSLFGISLACYRTVFPAVDNGAITAIQFEREKRFSPAIQFMAGIGKRSKTPQRS
jgi:probable phosphoglycerate mutase